MTSIRQAICDALYDRHDCRHLTADDVVKAEFRRGCAEINVTYRVYYGDEVDTNQATIASEDVFTAMLQQMIDEDHGHIPLEGQ